MDNLRAHHDPRGASRCRARGVRLLYLPPYSPDLNPIEASWALQKQHLRKYAPRSPDNLRRVARRAPAGRLATSVGGDERPPINSRALCGALFDVYLGEDPISDDGKRRVVAGFPGLLG